MGPPFGFIGLWAHPLGSLVYGPTLWVHWSVGPPFGVIGLGPPFVIGLWAHPLSLVYGPTLWGHWSVGPPFVIGLWAHPLGSLVCGPTLCHWSMGPPCEFIGLWAHPLGSLVYGPTLRAHWSVACLAVRSVSIAQLKPRPPKEPHRPVITSHLKNPIVLSSHVA